MVKTDWSSLTHINDSWVKKYLIEQRSVESKKLIVRSYSVAFSGTKQEFTGLVNFISDSIVHYIFDKAHIKEIEKKGYQPYRQALKKFGDIDPDRDGKYGELILFLLVEAILKTPMIAHKLQSLTSTNDQQKGGDGIFIGNYQGNSALLIGESKIWSHCINAVDDSFESTKRFHGEVSSTHKLDHELIIAKQTIDENLSREDLDFVIDSLDPSSEQFKNNILVHPILIMYDEPKIKKIEQDCLNKIQGEATMSTFMTSEICKLFSLVSKKLDTSYSELTPYYLHSAHPFNTNTFFHNFCPKVPISSCEFL